MRVGACARSEGGGRGRERGASHCGWGSTEVGSERWEQQGVNQVGKLWTRMGWKGWMRGGVEK